MGFFLIQSDTESEIRMWAHAEPDTESERASRKTVKLIQTRIRISNAYYDTVATGLEPATTVLETRS